MQIKITQTINVDPAKWAMEHNIDIKDVRADLKEYFASWCQMQIEYLNCAPDDSK
jgi:hypothetical protein